MKIKQQKSDAILEQLRMILDPDVGIDIVSLGLIYKVDVSKDNNVTITMTFTTPFCPSAPMLKEQIHQECETIGFEHVTIIVTFDPPWKCPEDIRMMLGI